MVRPWVLALAVVAVQATGCGSSGDEDEVSSLAQRWLAAAQARDATAQCSLLTPAAAQSAATGDETCVQAVSQLNLPGGGSVGDIEVWSDSALVRTGTDTLFLLRLADGWRVNGAGCTPQGDRPYDCDVEG